MALRVEIEQNSSLAPAPAIDEAASSPLPSPKPVRPAVKKAPRRPAKRTKPEKLTRSDTPTASAAPVVPVAITQPEAATPPDVRLPETVGRFRPSTHSFANRLCRALWGVAWLCLFRPSPKPLHRWRRSLLRLFGARIAEGVVVHPSARIWGPWNLEMAAHSCLSPHVDCYSVNTVRIGAYATVSQYSFLCTATHNADLPEMPLVTAPITIGDHAWVAADVFVGPNVTIGEGAVVGARSTVIRDVEPWTVVAGHPVRTLRKRPRAAAAGRPKSVPA